MEKEKGSGQEDIVEELIEKNKRLVKALQRVDGLEQENASLEDILECLQKEQLKLVEDYEQENYSLKNKLAVHEKLALQYDASLGEELEKWKIEKSRLEDRLSRQHKADLAVVRQQLEDTIAQLHQEKLINAQQLDTITMKKECIEKLTNDLRAARTSLNETLQVDFADLSTENDNLKLAVQENAVKELELRQSLEQLQEAVESAKIKEENWKYERENMQIELQSSYEMLESCREEQFQLREKLNASQNVGIKEKGNSLFAEVDDKRISAEKKLVGFASKYRCLQQQNQQFQRHILKLKMQIATLIETRSQTSDDKLIRTLDDALSSCRDENMKLMTELKRAREKVDNMEEARNYQLGDSSAIAKMLDNEIKMKNEELGKVCEELRLSKIYATVEAKKVLDLEKQLYEKGRLLDATNSSKYRLQLEFDEFKSNLKGSKMAGLEVAPSKDSCISKQNGSATAPDHHNENQLDSSERNEDDAVTDENADVEPVIVDSNKENEAPDSCTLDVVASQVRDASATRQSMPRIPLAERPIQPDHFLTAKDISKPGCSKQLVSKTAVKVNDKNKGEKIQSQKRPGFENTIETSMNDCKQQ